MGREDYVRDIELACDVATAAENARLAEGGLGPGDKIEGGIEFEGQAHMLDLPAAFPRHPIITTPDPGFALESDEYRELIEAPAAEPEPEKSTNVPASRKQDMRLRIDDIRACATGGVYPENVRLDVGYLLEVIDAFDNGRL